MVNFAILVPLYNEEETLIKTIYNIQNTNYPVLYVDDGSYDNSLKILKNNKVDYITYTLNKGKGGAIQLGVEFLIEKGYEWILIVDADLQMNLKDIPLFLCEAEIHNPKLIIGNRLYNPENMPFFRKITNKFISFIISLLIGQKIYDSQCGFKMIHKDIFQTLQFESDGFEFDSELIIKTALNDMKIINVPVTCIYNKNRKSKIKIFRDIFKFIDMLLRCL